MNKFVYLFASLIIFILIFVAGLLHFGNKWVFYIFPDGITIEQIIFHLSFPIKSVDSNILIHLISSVALPSLIIATIMALLPKCVIIINRHLHNRFITLLSSYIITFIVSIALLFVVIVEVNWNFSLTSYIDKIIHKQYSQFYEEHYKIPDSIALRDSKPKNLIVIFAESMESTFSAQNTPIGGGLYKLEINSTIFSPFGELIPNLTNIALNNTNFSDTNALGGIIQTNGTSYTIAGIVGYMCGIPLNTPLYTFNENIMLNSAPCISDILHDNGYKQTMIVGANNEFQGMHYFLTAHSITDKDAKYYKDIGKLSSDYELNWGFEDKKLFGFAKEELSNLAQNELFALYLLTTDTHFQIPHEFVDTTICPDLEDNSRNSFKCSDRIIGDFIDWAKKQDFYDNTTIIIVGDHLSPNIHIQDKNLHRRIYNTFINPHFSTTPTQNLTHNRHLSHFDMSVLMLDSIGFNIKAFGLGRNPLYDKTLLEIYNIDEFNTLITQDSMVYENFWNP